MPKIGCVSPGDSVNCPGFGRSIEEIDISNSRGRTRLLSSPDANQFHATTRLSCAWRGCDEPSFNGDIPVCFVHGVMISDYVLELLRFEDDGTRPPPPGALPARQPWVYYLMIGPSTVKIGTTTNLVHRMSSLRTDVQYVVAIERGNFRVEHQRHEQFAAERIGRREDFRLSERLKRHIDELRPNRDELVNLAVIQ